MKLIIGASGGIGQELYNHYKKKETCIGTYFSNQNFSDNRLIKVDISDYQFVENWINSISSKLKSIEIINCSGINTNSYSHKFDISEWEKIINVNLISNFNIIKCLLPFMRKEKYGRIVNFSSVTAQIPTPGISAYAASKSALWGLARTIAVENASLGITINNINLGYSEFGMIKNVPNQYLEMIKEKIPSKELCSSKDIINTVDFLINTKYINGSSIDLNGGIY